MYSTEIKQQVLNACLCVFVSVCVFVSIAVKTRTCTYVVHFRAYYSSLDASLTCRTMTKCARILTSVPH